MQGQYVYLKSEPGLYTVGFYGPDGKWNAESDHESTDAAAARVNFLNGGTEDFGGTITITVEGGCVTDVAGLPDGYVYEIDDRDAVEDED